MNDIGILRAPDLVLPDAVAPSKPAGQISFTSELGKALDSVDQLQVRADNEAQKVAQGGGNLHEMTLALQEADIGMRLATKVRSKVVDAYQEVMKMSV
jgi:flagellar hook-basal body complex protein FliE